MKECEVNPVSSRCCELGMQECEVKHDLKLIIATVNLMHKKEQKEFDDMYNFLCQNIPFPDRGRYAWHHVWAWGLLRWGKVWPKIEYRVSEMNRKQK